MIFLNPKFKMSLRNEFGNEFSKLLLIEHLPISTTNQESTLAFKSNNIYYQPELRISYPAYLFR